MSSPQTHFATRCNFQQRSWTQARTHAARLERRIWAALDEGDYRKARRMQWLFLKSKDAHLDAAREANRIAKRNVKVKKVRLRAIAARLDPWQPCAELVYVSAKRKSSGGYRPICAFGPENRARQQLITRALRPFFNPHPSQFQFCGGRSVATQLIANAVADPEFKFAGQLDIVNCFNSFETGDILNAIPLPEQVIRFVVLSEHLHMRVANRSLPIAILAPHTHGYAGGSLLAAARTGIAQGAICSSLVAEMLLSSRFSAFPENAKIFNFADNILVFGRTREETSTLLALCGHAIVSNPVPPFIAMARQNALSATMLAPRRLYDGFDFLGYTFRRRQGYSIAAPSAKNMQEFRKKFGAKAISAVRRYNETGGDFSSVRQMISSWCGAFRLWGQENVGVFRAIYLSDLDEIELACHLADDAMEA